MWSARNVTLGGDQPGHSLEDRGGAQHEAPGSASRRLVLGTAAVLKGVPWLVYTSDAADEEDRVDLGGRSIIQKTKTYAIIPKQNKIQSMIQESK